MSLPLLAYTEHHTGAVGVPWLQQDACHFNGRDYRLLQPSAWESSERSWDEGDPPFGTNKTADRGRGFGRWFGGGTLHIRPGNLWLRTDGGLAPGEKAGHDLLARIPAQTPGSAQWEERNPGFISASGGHWRILLQNATTGALLLDTIIPRNTLSAALPPLEGPAIFWARLEGAVRDWQMPPDYATVRGEVQPRFYYVEDGVRYIWDYEADVGRRPADHAQVSLTGVVMWEEHDALVRGGGLVHRGEWSQYISDGSQVEGGPWSALRIATGNAPFAVGALVQPAPGAVLQRLQTVDGAKVALEVPFHPLACSLSAFKVMERGEDAGEARVGGTIATRYGPAVAYYRFHPGGTGLGSNVGGNAFNGTLLGTSLNNYQAMCEASLYPTVSDILEVPDGTELILTTSTLFQYVPATNSDHVDTALLGIPLSTQGHPGGRCLRITEGEPKFFTEFFGDIGERPPAGEFAQAYNTLRTLDPHLVPRNGRGTSFHGHNCADSVWGKIYGWVLSASYATAGAQQFLAYLQGNRWISAGLSGFPANVYLWQRVRRVATKAGVRQIVSGKDSQGEGARWGVLDGEHFREGVLPFRARRLTASLMDGAGESGHERLFVVGRWVSKDQNGAWQCSLQQSVISLDGSFKEQTFTWNPDEQGFCTDLSDAQAQGLNPAHMAPFMWWIVDASQPAGGYWLPKTTAPGDSRPYLRLNVDPAHDELCYILENGPLPYDPLTWPTLKLPIYDDGSQGPDAVLPQAGPDNAQEALDDMPEGTKFVVVRCPLPPNVAWDAVQVDDMSDPEGPRLGEGATGLQKLAAIMKRYPNLWLRVDSTAPLNQLESYTSLTRWNVWKPLPKTATTRVDVVALVPPATYETPGRVFRPAVSPRAALQLPSELEFI